MSSSKRIVLFTWGSFGDLHPYMALAQGLKARGHRPAVAAPAVYRDKIHGAGLGFFPLRPVLPDPEEDPEIARRVMEAREGTRVIFRDLLMPGLSEMYVDADAAAAGADLVLSHAITYAVPMVAEKRGLPWMSTVLQPMVFVSAYDPPIPPTAPQMGWLRRYVPLPLMRKLIEKGKRDVLGWAPEIAQQRAAVGLPPATKNPIFEGQYSPWGTLALFSSALGAPQPDWPTGVIQTGFCFYDRARDEEAGLSPELEAFLAAGEPPIVFTLGTSAVMTAGSFYQESAQAARLLGRRAVLLIGKDPRNRPAEPLPGNVAAFEYAPYSQLFSRAAAIVHQGGVGTTAQALRSGRPQLVVPFAHDQPDNADRVTRLGLGGWVSRPAYRVESAARHLRRLLAEPGYATRAAEVGRRVQAEDGVAAACDAIERTLSSR